MEVAMEEVATNLVHGFDPGRYLVELRPQWKGVSSRASMDVCSGHCWSTKGRTVNAFLIFARSERRPYPIFTQKMRVRSRRSRLSGRSQITTAISKAAPREANMTLRKFSLVVSPAHGLHLPSPMYRLVSPLEVLQSTQYGPAIQSRKIVPSSTYPQMSGHTPPTQEEAETELSSSPDLRSGQGLRSVL